MVSVAGSIVMRNLRWPKTKMKTEITLKMQVRENMHSLSHAGTRMSLRTAGLLLLAAARPAGPCAA